MMIIIAGPCVMESSHERWRRDSSVIKLLNESVTKHKNKAYFKVSWKKANRTVIDDIAQCVDLWKFGDRLESLSEEYPEVGTVTDVHEVEDVNQVLKYVPSITALQIPAFLSRQTDLIRAVCDTGLDVVVKKGTWMGPQDVGHLAENLASLRKSDDQEMIIVDRGTCGGMCGTYGGNYAVDMLCVLTNTTTCYNRNIKYVFDLTHTYGQQLLGAGDYDLFMLYNSLAEAAMDLGCDGLFMEVSSDPKTASSDSDRQMNQTVFGNMMNHFNLTIG